MTSKWTLLIFTLFFSLVMGEVETKCSHGYSEASEGCVDYDECDMMPDICGKHATCTNMEGSYSCQCTDGFGPSGKVTVGAPITCKDINECITNSNICGPNARCTNTISKYYCFCENGFNTSTGVKTFHYSDNVTCRDIDECQQDNICGLNASCLNTQGSFYCVCNSGFRLKSGKSNFTDDSEQCQDTCMIDKTICGNGTCYRGASGHYCACHAGFTNYGNVKSPCTELNCDMFKDVNNLRETLAIAQDYFMQLNKTCHKLTESENPKEMDGEDLLKGLMSTVDELLFSRALNGKKKISTFLDLMEHALRLIGSFLSTPVTKRSSNYTEMELLVEKGSVLPKGTRTLSSTHAQLDIDLEVAAGDPSHYPGFTTVSLLSYSNLEEYADGFFSAMKPDEKQSYKINSKVVTVTVSNRNTRHLKEPIILTLHHLEQLNETSHTCVFWDSSENEGTWSSHGCSVVESNLKHTVCSCNYLSSFAVLMALYEVENKFALQLITWVGLSLSLICLFICILTFSLIRSIQGPRTTIHLHLCISLFIAILIFLAGISQTENRVGCAVVAGMLHFFCQAVFCWMCLEGIQLFRMVVLVFNTNFKTLYMMAGGYGVPAVIVAISALVNAKGYGTEKYCWLNLESIWSFFGPACVIIFVNIFFFLITVWKLAQKFLSLNPDLDSLQKIKDYTITAVAQLYILLYCILRAMWIFISFQFEKGTVAISYLFTIFGSLQGVTLFVMHCLFSKQVRGEYERILSQICEPHKKTYSEGSKSTQNTRESHV
ncbi:adhesion G protein-coupled receptor E1-like isoform X2 [Melanotaenia boesemani]|uniref:adhesion G protein-coupled receptor E1-like isoform X2 n=1 Tax=Melanotaenia boesemani TaxID=1250792 RepID=UPI001C0586D4|nr:adhesion G protein-coupled receptor E1-like isoform X2 [Melanotaenia boesemani]